MLMKSLTANRSSTRTAEHRRRQAARGYRRVELALPNEDVELVRHVAGALRAGGDQAGRLREAMRRVIELHPARTGADLVAFLRSSPLVGEDLVFERDRSPGRSVEF